jgi:hypothetical protein
MDRKQATTEVFLFRKKIINVQLMINILDSLAIGGIVGLLQNSAQRREREREREDTTTTTTQTTTTNTTHTYHYSKTSSQTTQPKMASPKLHRQKLEVHSEHQPCLY